MGRRLNGPHIDRVQQSLTEETSSSYNHQLFVQLVIKVTIRVFFLFSFKFSYELSVLYVYDQVRQAVTMVTCDISDIVSCMDSDFEWLRIFCCICFLLLAVCVKSCVFWLWKFVWVYKIKTVMAPSLTTICAVRVSGCFLFLTESIHRLLLASIFVQCSHHLPRHKPMKISRPCDWNYPWQRTTSNSTSVSED